MNVPKQGTAFADPEIDAIYDPYQRKKQTIGWFVMGMIFLEAQVLPHCMTVLMGIVSCKKCIFFQRQEEKDWVAK